MLKQIWRSRGRGRPPNRGYSSKDEKILESLARIAVRSKVDSNIFFNCIVKAWKNDEAECKQLIIWCRERKKDSAVFLFTHGQKVTAQFPIPTTILQGNNRIESYMKRIRPKWASSGKINVQIKDLKAGMKKVYLKAKVIEKPEPKRVYTRFGTTPAVSNILIEDETGSMRMGLWNQQIKKVHKGDVIDIENGKVTWFRGERQLGLGRKGSLSVQANE